MVISIIVLLVAILLPTLKRIKQHTKSAACQSNLRQWGSIFQSYVQRNDGKFLKGRGWGWMYQLDNEHKDRHKMRIWFCPSADKPLYDENRNRTRESNVYSAWGIYQGQEYEPTGMAGSYGLNGYSLDQRPGFIFEGGRDTTNNWRIPNVEGADSVPLFIDALRFDLWPLASDGPPKDADMPWQALNHMTRCCIDRHNASVNCLFMDWSVRKVGLKELWTLKWHRKFNVNGPWTKAGGVQPSDWPEWMRRFKDY